MTRKLISMGVLVAGLLATATAFADHNSPMGEGWANMPNDIHNTRIETMGDNEAFAEFVREGNGADSVNRFSDTSEVPDRGFDRSAIMRGAPRGGRR